MSGREATNTTDRSRLRKRFGAHVNRQRIVCLDIPDEYEYMDPALVAILETRVPRYLRMVR